MNVSHEILYLFTPLIGPNIYGDEIDLSEFISLDQSTEIKQFIDSEDYEIGVVSFADIDLLCDNRNGIFNSPEDYRSLFGYTRDLAKIRIVLRERSVTYDSNQIVSDSSYVDTILFSGLLAEDALREDIEAETVTLKVLSIDSIIHRAKVDQGVIADGDDGEVALFSILNQDVILSVLDIVPTNLNFPVDFTIDDSEPFQNISVFEAIKFLMTAANGIVTIDSANALHVSDRSVNTLISTLYLYGKYSLHGRENILNIQNYNDGYHRMVNSFKYSTFETNDPGHIEEFGLRQRELDLSFLTNSVSILATLNSFLAEFKVPRIELEVAVPLTIGKDTEILQGVSIDYPLRVIPENSTFLPITGDAIYSDSETPYPNLVGVRSINPNIEFKIIEKRINITDWVVILKLRRSGSNYGEGFI